jgi:two-component system response regulator (stage 0 sporulation protein F)
MDLSSTAKGVAAQGVQAVTDPTPENRRPFEPEAWRWSSASYHEPATIRKPGVLVVDDQDCVRTMLAVALRPLGFAVWQAANGREALDLLRDNCGAIDVALIDLFMPGLDGHQTLGELKKLDPVIQCCLMSGDLDARAEGELSDSGVAAIFLKPFRLNEVLLTLSELAYARTLGQPSI